MKRNANIELLRILACIMVISIHTLRLAYGMKEVQTDIFRVITIPAVGIFWMITGYFIFRGNKPYIQKVKSTICNVFLPAVFTIIITQFFLRWINGQCSLTECFRNPVFDARAVFGGILNWSSDISMSSHLWYVFAYLRLIVWFPLLNYICKDSPVENKIRRGYLVLFFVRSVIYNIQYIMLPLAGFNRGVDFYLPFDANIFYVLLGYEIRILMDKKQSNGNQEDTQNRKWLFVFPAVWFLINGINFILVSITRKMNLNENYYTSIKNAPVILATLCIFIFIMYIKIPKYFKGMICYLGGKTYCVYLIHFCVIRKIWKSELLREYIGGLSPLPQFLAYLGINIVMSFVVATIIMFIIHGLKKCLLIILGEK